MFMRITRKPTRIGIIKITRKPTEGDAYTKLGLAVVVLILEGLHAVCYRHLSIMIIIAFLIVIIIIMIIIITILK